MPKNKTKGQLVKILDRWFSKYIRLRDVNKGGNIKCITCGKVVHWKQSHCCHYIGRGNYMYRRDEKNCHAGCSHCNTFNQEEHMRKYTLFMIDNYGRDLVEEMMSNKWTVRDYKKWEIEEMLVEYKKKVKKFEETDVHNPEYIESLLDSIK